MIRDADLAFLFTRIFYVSIDAWRFLLFRNIASLARDARTTATDTHSRFHQHPEVRRLCQLPWPRSHSHSHLQLARVPKQLVKVFLFYAPHTFQRERPKHNLPLCLWPGPLRSLHSSPLYVENNNEKVCRG